ncbi:MAG: (Fe-S)-binding protein [Deltaproteobacteria bacterium]|nr:(Fe-S)-binding protein [Deltaproteobacteria bacterium]MBW2308494.1 (Fe-S)-binding protein [Deltaproteobacteria bacterium]
MTSLEYIHNAIAKCAKCGSCRSVCPVFLEEGREASVARGKIALVEAVHNDGLEPSERLCAILDNCLLCMSCVENCPNSVPVHEIIVAARAEMAQKRGTHWAKRFILKGIVARAKVLRAAISMGSLFQYLLFQRIPGTSGLRRRFPLPLVDSKRLIPQIPLRSLMMRLPEVSPAVGKEERRVLFFSGCAIRYLMPEIGVNLVRLLTRHGTTVVLPRDQVCCGVAAEASGYVDTAVRLEESNRNVFERQSFDAIVSACATCGNALRNKYGDHKVLDISELLAEAVDWSQMEPRPDLRDAVVTYHDPCHLRKGQGIVAQPRKILRALFGQQFVEMDEPGRCCGSGGSYGVTHYEVSRKILQHKVEDIGSTGARIVVTGCPGCIIQLRDGLHRAGMDVHVRHLLEVIAGAGSESA